MAGDDPDVDPELEAADPATAAAWAVVLAQVLPEVGEQARPSGPVPGDSPSAASRRGARSPGGWSN